MTQTQTRRRSRKILLPPPVPEPEQPTFADESMTIEEAAEYLSVSSRTLQRWIQLREIEFIRIGRLTKFTRAILNRYIRDHTVAPRRVR